jgi:uncharacterized protein YegJ (DUF2314 family)
MADARRRWFKTALAQVYYQCQHTGKASVLWMIGEEWTIENKMSTNVRRGVLALAACLCVAAAIGHCMLMLSGIRDGQSVSNLTFRIVLWALLGAWLFYRFLEDDGIGESSSLDRPFASVVVLLGEPRLMTAEGLRRAAEKALGVDLEEDCFSGQSSSFLWEYRDHLYLINNSRGSYYTDSIKDARCIPDENLRGALDSYRGWLSVDLIRYPDGASIDSTYRVIGPLVTELHGADFVAMHVPAAGFWGVWEESYLELLLTSDVLGAIECGGVPSMCDFPAGEPALLRAAGEARQRWTEFVSAFQNRESTQSFYVKVGLMQGADREFPWLSVTGVDSRGVTGTLDNEGVTLSLRPGTTVVAPLDDVWDWMIVPAGGAAPIGYFTQEALPSAG